MFINIIYLTFICKWIHPTYIILNKFFFTKVLNNIFYVYKFGSYSRYNILCEMCTRGNCNNVKLILDNITRTNTRILKNSNALIYACENGFYDIAKILLDKRIVDINAHSDRALDVACTNGYRNIVELLINNGANIHSDNDYPFQVACANGYYDIVKFLYDNGANIHADDSDAFYCAISKRRHDIIKFLIKSGIDMNNNYIRAIQLAEKVRDDKIINLLLNYRNNNIIN